MTADIQIEVDVSTLEVIEGQIETARLTISENYWKVGKLLAEVRESRLYAEKYGTFEDYVEKRWEISRSRAYQLMEGAETAARVNHLVDIPTERAARELAKAPPRSQVKVAKRIAKALKGTDKRVTAKIIEAEVLREMPRGGLAAAAMAAKEHESTSESPAEIVIDLSPAQKAKVVRIIQEWFGRERLKLGEYPAASPQRMVNLITQLFE